MPRLQKIHPALDHHGSKLCQFVISKPFRPCQGNWVYPKFRNPLALFHMDMRRFVSFSAKEEIPETIMVQNRRHVNSL